MEIGAKIIVKGIVQGVGFRYFVFHSAIRLGLRGYVQNLYNGAVEINVEGERGLIEELIRDVKVGPPLANVKDVKVTWNKADKLYKHFEIK